MLVLRLYQLVHKRYPHGSEPSHVLLPPHRTSTNITTHHTCFQCTGNADYSPHLPTTNTPPQHPLQRATQCRSATCPPSTPHAPPPAAWIAVSSSNLPTTNTPCNTHTTKFLDHNSSAWNTESSSICHHQHPMPPANIRIHINQSTHLFVLQE